jgi:hypothetical protein
MSGSTAAAGWLALLTVMHLAGAPAASAQLRPLEPLEWSAFRGTNTFAAAAGGGVYGGQRASLAAVEGRLVELGEFVVLWRAGRVALEGGGTVRRIFDERAQRGEPYPGTRPSSSGRRQDSGDYRVTTNVLLSPRHWPAAAVLRFGTRLPTTDNTVGLDRDQIDFFALLGGRGERGPFVLAAELGLGIHGTRDPVFEQNDVLLYAAAAHWTAGPATLRALLLGQADGLRGWELRGTEDLREVRLGVRLGRARWVEAAWVRGLVRHSPRRGLRVGVGLAGN